MGVTGTLEALSTDERKVIKGDYMIEQFSFMPSVYPANKRKFRKNDANDLQIVKEQDYFVVIANEIEKRRKQIDANFLRPVLVFFETEQKLRSFLDSKPFAAYRDSAAVMTETLDGASKTYAIDRASEKGRITLLTRTFGRGTDFKIRDSKLSENGGIHVIQTFLSEEISEETQIQGRSARQGDQGSYSMILSRTDLEKFFPTVGKKDCDAQLDEIVNSNELYQPLHEARNKFFAESYAKRQGRVKNAYAEHEQSLQMIGVMMAGDLPKVAAELALRNPGPKMVTTSSKSRTVILMDATGSMRHCMEGAKDAIMDMVNNVRQTVAEFNSKQSEQINSDFELQFVLYRNYNSAPADILVVGPWDSDPVTLHQFLSPKTVSGGNGNEALEVALHHAVQVSESKHGLSQVVLIGDAPPNTKEEVARKRGNKWDSEPGFETPLYWEDEVAKLKEKECKVMAFYVKKNKAVKAFKDIVVAAGGVEENAQFLDVNRDAKNASALLANTISKEILKNLAGAKADAVMEVFQKYQKSYT
eukprot:TRINITY_DN8299_c0_g1_i1.p1 TRINITY_DN8299_c0_g1~~TRINITY_DN8299_c0_g1_i1.p1  ORF type:complete len:571 (-),score=129.57 TRINITY_DN8299_c0_g1_i1:14-1606(-)